MKVEVDQSIKIEQTNRDTIIAFSNNFSCSVIISSNAKKRIKKRFRELGKTHLFYYRTFAAGVVLLIKDHLQKIDMIVIDREYVGREKLIEDMILEMLKRLRRKQPRIYFRQIGKKSNAHNVAYYVMKKELKPNKILKLKELESLIFPK